MQVDIGNNQICQNFTSIVSSAEIRSLNERLQLEHSGVAPSTAEDPQATSPHHRVDPTADALVPQQSNSPSARRASVNLSRTSAGSRNSQQHRRRLHHSSAAHSRSNPSLNADEEAYAATPCNQSGFLVIAATGDFTVPPTPTSYRYRRSRHSAQLAHADAMAAVISPTQRHSSGSGGGGNGNGGAAAVGVTWNDQVVRNGSANRGGNGRAEPPHRRPEDGAAGGGGGGSQGANGSGNGDKAAPHAGPKLAQTKVQLGMRIRRWLIINRIGAGSFGETFTGMEMDGPPTEDDAFTVTPENLAILNNLPPLEERREVCIKVEQENKNVLRLEALALKKVQPCPQVVRYLGSGCTRSMNFLVMEKLGSNLAELRRRSQHGTFNIYTTLKAGISCLVAIRGVHDLGLVHRDIKPSNFVTGLPNSADHTTCFLIDFGLARRFRRSNGEIRPPRDNAGFRGTSRYASVASHHHQELGRVDDLWSLLFMLVEFATGTLPWRKYKDKDDIGRCKEDSITPHLVRNLPREFQPFLAHLQTLRYEDEPDYDLLLTLMHRALERRGYPANKPVEWELDPSMMDSTNDGEGQEAGPSRPPPNPDTLANVNNYTGADGQLPRRAAPTPDGDADKPSAPGRAGPTLSGPPLVPSGTGAAGEVPRQSSLLRVSDVDVAGGAAPNGGTPRGQMRSVGPAHSGVTEERGGIGDGRGGAPDGSETPLAQNSTDNLRQQDFSPRENSGLAADDRAEGADGVQPNSALEPNNSAPWRDGAGEVDSGVEGAQDHPMNGAAADLDAANGEAAGARQAEDAKKKKKTAKSDCKCAVM